MEYHKDQKHVGGEVISQAGSGWFGHLSFELQEKISLGATG